MKRLATSILAFSLLGCLQQAIAGPTMRLSSDGGATWIVVEDNGPLDANPTIGLVEYVGPVGGWSVNIDTGFGQPLLGNAITPAMDVGSTSQSAGPATLIVQLSDTNFTAFPNETFIAESSGFAGGTALYTAYRDSGNVLFGSTATYTGGSVGSSPSPTASTLLVEGPNSGNYANSNGVVVPNGTGPFSLTLETVVVHTSATHSSTDSSIYALPPPPCNCTLTFNSPSQITNCAGDIIPDVTASQDCGNGPVSVPVSLVSSNATGTCPLVITRSYTATDNCGVTYPFSQTITVNCKPLCDITTSTSNTVAGTTGLTAWVADAGPGATYEWTTNNAIITAGQGTTNITWTAGPDASQMATICVKITTAAGCVSQCCTYVKLTPPCICTLKFNSPTSITNCADDAIADVTASQNCGPAGWVSVPVSFVSATTNGVCPQIITRKYTATDNCGTTYPFTQTITVNCKPNCTITPSVTTAMVGDTNTASVADAGAGATYNWSIMNGSIVSGQNTKTLTWKAGTDTNSPVNIMITITSAAGCSSSCSTPVKLTPQPPKIALGSGDAATIGFWNNKNGQGIINNASNSPALANWLATSFPCLYSNLAGKPNSCIASNFAYIFKNGGSPKVDAQIMAVAFACYFTSTSLGGGTGPKSFGFNQSTGGTGTHTINVGSKGTDLGLTVNGTYTILDILKAANAWRCAHPGVAFSSNVNDLFNAINTGGDIN